MNLGRTIRIITLSGATLAASLYASAAEPLKVDFANESVGAEPTSFASVVGIWRIEVEGDNKVLAVDGRQWKEGQTATGLADKARALYGERYAEFLDRVQAFAYFPYTVATEVADFRNGEISVRFKGISGRIDQAAGILFDLKPTGDYLALRANPLEKNLVLWKFEKGKTLVGEMDSRHADAYARLACAHAPHRWFEGRGPARRQAVLGAHPAGACFRAYRSMVQGGQPGVFR